MPGRSILIATGNPSRWLALLCAVAILSSHSLIAEGSAPVPTLEVLPASSEFPPLGATRSMLVLRNPTADSLADIRVAPVTDLGVTIASEPALNLARTAAPGGEISWRIDVADTALDVTSGSIMFEVAYTRIAASTRSATPRVLTSTLAIKRREIADFVDIRIETTLDALDDSHPGIIYLVVTNKSSLTATVAGIKPSVPDFIHIGGDTIEAAIAQASFPPHETGVIRLPIKTSARVQPGKHLLLFSIQLTWEDHGEVARRNIIVKRDVTVGVYGESVVLSVLAIPSILLMPGVLILVVWNLLWSRKLFRKKGDDAPFFVTLDSDTKKLELGITTAVVSTTISMIVVAIYIARFGNILVAYGLRDLVVLWLISVFIFGFGLYSLFSLYRYLRHRRVYVTWDDASRTLVKMGRNGESIRRDVRRLTLNGASGDVYLLEELREGMEEVWVSPHMVITEKIGNDGKRVIDDEAHEKISDALEPESDGNSKDLAKLLASEREALDVSFLRGGIIAGPTKVPVTSLSQEATRDLIIDL